MAIRGISVRVIVWGVIVRIKGIEMRLLQK